MWNYLSISRINFSYPDAESFVITLIFQKVSQSEWPLLVAGTRGLFVKKQITGEQDERKHLPGRPQLVVNVGLCVRLFTSEPVLNLRACTISTRPRKECGRTGDLPNESTGVICRVESWAGACYSVLASPHLSFGLLLDWKHRSTSRHTYGPQFLPVNNWRIRTDP